ncbi:hypothetical protein PORY_000093 [Pneumocystis oryctolagi]|uniref:Uncharacterized protein n=1 Tax=Pneumocystis oryctolagi TaxID=42067 RepID=A0ACB7CFF0_9ASCO|nr:hypothetical protein PORY_000093 [Pneumocystis oryctolagi]
MLIESAYDAQLSRTRGRPLVRGVVSPAVVFSFVCVTGLLGTASLGCTGRMTAWLGVGNMFLYAGVYTPLKRWSIVNTWVGAVVGAVPPLMGWSARTGGDLMGHGGGWVLAGIVYAWQFPHFNALSWGFREEYARTGYRMMCVTHPALNARVALRYSLWCLVLCWALPMTGLLDRFYLVDSTVVNAFMAIYAWRFYRHPCAKSARELFFASLVHLPSVFLLALAHKILALWRTQYTLHG